MVDDDATVRASCRRVLEADGHAVVAAAGADEALEAMSTQGFELALIDVKMPERDGIWLVQQIKGRRPDLPIVVISGYATVETANAVFAQRVASFVPKPFTPDELLEAVNRCGQGMRECEHRELW